MFIPYFNIKPDEHVADGDRTLVRWVFQLINGLGDEGCPTLLNTVWYTIPPPLS